ncbi:MAG: hypothetical protein M1831_002504 [Alyxoria varia]|nr:MAG: hypothetical protein M1831_002504 [Alyxoria varia]
MAAIPDPDPSKSPASPTSADFRDAQEATSPISVTSTDSVPKVRGALLGPNSTPDEREPAGATDFPHGRSHDGSDETDSIREETGLESQGYMPSNRLQERENPGLDLGQNNEITEGRLAQPRNHAQVDGAVENSSDSRVYGTSHGTQTSTTQPADSSQSSDERFLNNVKGPSFNGPFEGIILSEPLPPSRPSAPPPLNYTLRTRKAAIAIFWTLILIDSIAIPLVLYFTLDRLTSLDQNAVFSISTACLGGISIIEYFVRFYRLWKKNSTCRVIGAHRWYLDFFHWNFSIAWIFIMFELIIGTAFETPPIRVLAMPVASLLWWFAFELLVADAMRYLGFPAPCRMSSVPKGHPLRPAISYIIEDVVAVDGSGGTQFRIEFNERYEASHYFRQMLHRLTIFWATGCLGCALLTTILIFTLDREVAYIVGWVLPFIWAGIWVLLTFPYVQRCLRREKVKWREAKALP